MQNLLGKKKAKMNISETKVKTEVDSSSSDHPCPLALVTASNVRKDTQCLRQDLCPTVSIHDGTQGDNNKKKRRGRPPTSPSQKQFMKLKLAHDSLIKYRQYLSVPFMRANGMTKPGLITLVGKDGAKWKVNLYEEKSGSSLCLGKGWKDFAKANGLKTGEYFTLESAWKNEIPMLSLVNTESASDGKERGESSKAMEKERSTDTSSIVQNRVVTLALETKDVKACTLHLPSEFVTAVGIKKLGEITLLGRDGMKWCGCLLSRDGTVAVGVGWRNFCEANGVKLGDSFSLVFINEEEDTGPVFKFSPNSGN
ncbi:B3 domain-containing protein REM12-like isoform X1 [Brassica rapa]|uniref:B3 domain-containing protein REM12-like isoform X1 n=2 Tax=Brassica campestris TaxID=3711 RepID=UPI00142D7EC8|nr:B3 domain-containing protein REM12-like isoform X1 [Brassica rapa]XP_033145334.1 B3 domain-containing protein REM12-like isoform X1 [Brassica rapa]